jgi:hypothetical protein
LLRRTVATHPYSLATIAVLVGLGIQAVAKSGSGWNQVYVMPAALLLQGRDFYREIPAFTYPPFSAWIFTPFVFLRPWAARAVWYLVCATALVYLCMKAWRLAGGSKLESPGRSTPTRRREQIAFLLGQAIAFKFVINVLSHLQTDLVIAALLMAGCAAIGAAHYFRAATWIGCAAAFKATPLLFAAYLLWRRQWLAAVWLLCVAVGANLLPDTIHRPPDGGVWSVHWYQRYLRPMGSATYLPGDWHNQLNNNQSIAGAVRRWLGTSWRSAPKAFVVFDRPGAPTKNIIRMVYYVCCMSVLLPVLLVEWRRRRAREPAAVPLPKDELDLYDASAIPAASQIECGIVLLLMLLLSPNSSPAHFCVMLLPAFCIARLAVYTRGWGLRALLALAILFSILSIHVRIPSTLAAEQILLWLGTISASAFFLLLACIAALLRPMYLPVANENGPHGRHVAPGQDA